jgi:hypothetical protein
MTNQPTQTFGDIVNRIGDSDRSDAEVAATVAQLLNSGRLRFNDQLAGRRVVVCPSLDTFLHRVQS